MYSGSIIPFCSEFLPYTRFKRDLIHRSPGPTMLIIVDALTIQAINLARSHYCAWFEKLFFCNQQNQDRRSFSLSIKTMEWLAASMVSQVSRSLAGSDLPEV